MSEERLRIAFLIDRASSESRPLVSLVGGEERGPLLLSDRARAFIAVLAVPRDFADGGTAGSPALSQWTTEEVVRGMQHRDASSITRAREDLAKVFDEPSLERYFVHPRGSYGLKNAQVDVVDLILAAGTPDEVDRALGEIGVDPAGLGLSLAHIHLFSRMVVDRLDQILKEAGERWAQRQSTEPDSALPGPRSAGAARHATQPPSEITDSARPSVSSKNRYAETGPQVEKIGTGEADRPHVNRKASRAGPRRIRPLTGAVAVISVLAVIALFAVVSSGGQPRRAGRLRNEVAGGPTHTWSNYKTAEGRPGKPLEQGEHVSVTCKVLGYQVPDGDKWWYRLESSPYNNHFYATADAFYNNGQTSGSLRGSLFVDPRLRRCGA